MTISSSRPNLPAIMECVWKQLRKPAEMLRAYYEQALGRPITMRQAWLLSNAMAAFFTSAFVAGAPILARLAGCVWVITALNKCRKEL